MSEVFVQRVGSLISALFVSAVLVVVCFALTLQTAEARERGERLDRGDRTPTTGVRSDREIADRDERLPGPRPEEDDDQGDDGDDGDDGGDGGDDSDEDEKDDEENRITLRELGLLQLAAHDFFNVDRQAEVDHENGKLDLSTLLDHGDDFIAIGGEARNRENIILFSVAKEYGERYEKYLKKGIPSDTARNMLLYRYHRELKEVHEKLFGEMLDAYDGEATMTENVAFRTIHDFLPGTVKTRHKEVLTVNESLVGKHLTSAELDQLTGPLDGEFDPAFREVKIVIPPNIVLEIDLFERDSSFAQQFNTDFSFEYFMDELKDGRYDEYDEVTKQIRNLFAKGMYLD